MSEEEEYKRSEVQFTVVYSRYLFDVVKILPQYSDTYMWDIIFFKSQNIIVY